MGISTLCAMHGLHQMLFKENFKILIIATKQDVARNIVKMIQVMYDNLPVWMRSIAKIQNNNKLELVLSNGSQVKAVSSKPDSARGSAISLLILDEFAFMTEANEIWTSAQSTLSTGGDAILLSTPNGASGTFYDIWQKAEIRQGVDGLGAFNPIKIDWKRHPERDQKWRDLQDEVLNDKRLAAQENDCLGAESMITVRDKFTGVIKKVSLGELFGEIHVDNSIYEILTPSGFKDFAGIRQVSKPSFIVIELSNGQYIKSSFDHPFILDGNPILAHELIIGTRIDSTGDPIYVVNIDVMFDDIILYDVMEVNDGNIFITNDIVSHNCNFLTSGHTVLETDTLEHYRSIAEEPVEYRGIGGEYWIYSYPQAGRDYVVVADVSRGDGEDYSGFEVFDVETCEQVAEYKGKIDTTMYGNFLTSVAFEWNAALLVIDNRNIGWATIQVVLDKGYPNLYYSYRHDPYLDENIQVHKQYDLKNKEDMVPGFTTTPLIRPIMISKLVEYTRAKSITLKSKRLITELNSFVWLNGKPQAQYGSNDDLVLCVCMFLFVRDTALRMRQMGIDLVKNSMSHVHRTVYVPKQTQHPNWTMNVGKGKENLKWLL